jgi:hypothetical protein
VANGEVDILLDKCLFLDPRFKDRFSITDEPVKAVLEEIDTSVSLTQCHQTEVRNSTSDCDKEPPGKKGKFRTVFGRSTPSPNSSSLSTSDRIRREAEMYMQYPTMDIDGCPLEWWKLEANRLLLLSSLARKYLCVCASSVPSERVFCIGGT